MTDKFDIIKALHTLTYDLETESGYFNMSRMYTALLDRCANEAVKAFRRLEVISDFLNIKKSKGSYIRDEWARIDSNQRLSKRFRKKCKEYYAHFFDEMLNSKIDYEMEYSMYFNSHEMGGHLADDFVRKICDTIIYGKN